MPDCFFTAIADDGLKVEVFLNGDSISSVSAKKVNWADPKLGLQFARTMRERRSAQASAEEEVKVFLLI